MKCPYCNSHDTYKSDHSWVCNDCGSRFNGWDTTHIENGDNMSED